MSQNSKAETILNGLNPNQYQAASITTGSTLVIAGAGSGKTSVLTRRVANLIATGVTPGEILCLTFTNKAAREMDSRVKKTLESVGIALEQIPIWQTDYLHRPLLCTFHSLGVRLLREFGEKLDLKSSFSILDTDDQKKTIKRILKDLNIDAKNLSPSSALYFISKCKQELLLAKDSKKISRDYLPIFHQIYAKYELELKNSQTVDFDDLILLPYILLSENIDALKTLHSRWKHLLVDEFQDTNPAQFALIKLLYPTEFLDEEERSIFVVGDDAQSIYGFRGSKIEIILNFEKEYQGTQEITLNQNYRSTQPILDLAEKVISHNNGQKKKDLFTDNPQSEIKVKYYLAKNGQDEAEYIISQLYDLYVPKESSKEAPETKEIRLEVSDFFDKPIASPANDSQPGSTDPVSSMFDVYLDQEEFSSTSPSFSGYQASSWQVPRYNWSKVKGLDEVVVLYRTHAMSRSLEETFLKHNLPYKLVSGTRFLDRKEVKDTLALLKFLANGQDKVSLSRFLPLVMDGVGVKTMQKIIAYLEDYEYPLAPKYQQKVLDFFSDIQSVWQNHDNLIDLTKELLAVSGYLNYLKSAYPIKEEFESRVENIGEIYSLMLPFDEDRTVDISIRLERFLEQVSLMGQVDQEEVDNTPKISLMSLHQSKGLEFETVFLVGLEDGILPHQNSLFEKGGIEEEVRLAYVGVTRAKKYLHLISADARVQFGQVNVNPVSRIFRPFLDTHCQRVKR